MTLERNVSRYSPTKAIIQLIVLLSGRAYTLAEIAKVTNTCTRTAHRRIRALEEIGVMVYQEDEKVDTGKGLSILYRVDPHWMRKFL